MKHLILTLAIVALFGLSSYGQKTATYDQVANKEVKGGVYKYTTEAGVTFTIGDTLRLGYPHRNDVYDFVIDRGKAWTSAMATGHNNTGSITSTEAGQIAVIKSMKTSKRLLYVTTLAKGESKPFNITNFEEAFKTGEIIKPGHITSDVALELLLKAKQKLDLELISLIEYNAIKAELSNYIQ